MVEQQQINLSLEQLAAEVALTLEHYNLLGSMHDNRVSPVPDARTIRYYTSLGLLDRPWMEGRQARYGRRHLLQLVAVKALQSHGLPLSQVQSRLYGLTDAELETLLVSIAGDQQPQAAKSKRTLQPITWDELVIEPGLRVMIEESWSPTGNLDETEAKIRAALAALIELRTRQRRS